MGTYCCCGVKKRDGWVCECDWNGWFLCFNNFLDGDNFPKHIPVKKKPDKDGLYLVRIFEDGDFKETESEFSLTEKNWGEPTNQAISHWKITYDDTWGEYSDVYAWKEKQ